MSLITPPRLPNHRGGISNQYALEVFIKGLVEIRCPLPFAPCPCPLPLAPRGKLLTKKRLRGALLSNDQPSSLHLNINPNQPQSSPDAHRMISRYQSLRCISRHWVHGSNNCLARRTFYGSWVQDLSARIPLLRVAMEPRKVFHAIRQRAHLFSHATEMSIYRGLHHYTEYGTAKRRRLSVQAIPGREIRLLYEYSA